MTQLDDLYIKHDREAEIIARCRPELDALKAEIGPWLRDVASGRQSVEPVAARQRQAALQAEIWQARDFAETQRELGMAENHSRRIQALIAEYDAEIARLEAIPPSTPTADALISERLRWQRGYRASYQITLDLVGLPRAAALVG